MWSVIAGLIAVAIGASAALGSEKTLLHSADGSIEIEAGANAVRMQEPSAPSPGERMLDVKALLQQDVAAHASALVSGCAEPHYLLDTRADGTPGFNRLRWWDKRAPLTGPIRVNGSSDITFECEFFPGLTTIVGAELDIGSGITNLRDSGYNVIAWDASAATGRFEVDGIDALPGLELAVRFDRPRSAPVLEEADLPGGERKRVLVNRPDEGYVPKEGERRPSLWIDFARGQRAVGLEYGYAALPGDPDNTIGAAGVRLVAYDAAGRVISESTGDLLDVGRSRLTPGVVAHRIGVRDERGRIATVELRFEDEDPSEPGTPIREPQVVYRIWHAPLPPAAVAQGAIALGRAAQGRDGAAEIPLDAVTHTLPFQTDRAVVILRGFKVAYADGRPHRTARLGASLGPGGVFAPGVGGRVTIGADALLLPSADNHGLTNDAVVYYSLLAWDSTQTEVFTAPIGGWVESTQTGTARGWLEAGDPCPIGVLSTSPHPDTYRADAEAVCGQPFAAAHGLYMSSAWAWNDQSLDDIHVYLDVYPIGIGWALGPRATAFDDDRRVDWQVVGELSGDGRDGVSLRVDGTVLDGRSIRTGPDSATDPSGIALDHPLLTGVRETLPRVRERPPRGTDGHWYSTWADIRGLGWSWPLVADMAVVGLRQALLLPGGEPRELEIEVEGVDYDGRVVDWQWGGGIGTGNAIQGGAPWSSGGDHGIFAGALFSGVRSVRAFAAPELQVASPIECTGVVGLGAQACDMATAVRNIGEGQVLITTVLRGTDPQDARFHYTFVYRGQRIHDLAALRARLPLQLRPGESLIVSAAYSPEAPADGSGTFLDIGLLHLRTRDAAVRTSVWANGRGQLPAPAAGWVPTSLSIAPAIGGLRSQQAGLCSTGETPLVVHWSNASGGIYIDPPVAGLSAAPAPSQIETDCLRVVVAYAGLVGAPRETTLYADTNAGLIALPITLLGQL